MNINITVISIMTGSSITSTPPTAMPTTKIMFTSLLDDIDTSARNVMIYYM